MGKLAKNSNSGFEFCGKVFRRRKLQLRIVQGTRSSLLFSFSSSRNYEGRMFCLRTRPRRVGRKVMVDNKTCKVPPELFVSSETIVNFCIWPQKTSPEESGRKWPSPAFKALNLERLVRANGVVLEGIEPI